MTGSNSNNTLLSSLSCCEAFLCLDIGEGVVVEDASIRDSNNSKAQKLSVEGRTPTRKSVAASIMDDDEENNDPTEGFDSVDNLDDELANMDIMDFDELDADDAADTDNDDEEARQRSAPLVVTEHPIDRDELFSRKYKPTVQETQELNDLAIELGIVSKTNGLMASFRRTKTQVANLASWTALLEESGVVLIHKATGEMIIGGEQDSESPARIEPSAETADEGSPPTTTSPETTTATSATTTVPCTVCILNRGIVIVPTTEAATLATILPWSSICHVNTSCTPSQFSLTLREDDDNAATTPNSITIRNTADTDDSNTILERCVWKYHEPNRCDFGWQYRVVYRYGYTEAVLDKELPGVGGGDPTGDFTSPDAWNGLAPLHYAVKCRNAVSLASLLQQSSLFPVDTPDAHDHSALYWAVTEEYHDLADILRQHGATPVETERGELLGQVAATQEKLDRERTEREQLEQQEKANNATQSMQQNMQLLQERGEQIQQLGDTTRQVQEGAADYSSMAKQLKANLQQRNSRWGLF